MASDADKSGTQKAAEADVEGFKQDLGPFVVAAETTRMPMVFTNAKTPGHPIIFANQAFLTLSGHEEHELLGQCFNFMMERDNDPDALAEIQTAFEGGRDLDTQVRCRRKDGKLLWVTVFINPVRDEGGSVVQHFASFVDITRLKEEGERLQSLLVSISDLISVARASEQRST